MKHDDMTCLSSSSIHIGCNNTAESISEASSLNPNLVAYAANTSVAIYDTAAIRIQRLLSGHEGKVTNVQWLRDTNVIISAGMDGTVRIWDLNDPTSHSRILWTTSVTTISSLAGIQLMTHDEKNPSSSSSILIVASCSNKSLVVLHTQLGNSHSNANAFEPLLLSPAEAGNTILKCLALVEMTTDQVLVCSGGVDRQVHVFEIQIQSSDLRWTHIKSQVGHRGWIQAIAICRLSDLQGSSSGMFQLATASQDTKICIWHLSLTDDDRILEKRAVLVGHQDWVTSVQWKNASTLLSCSMDHTAILWEHIPTNDDDAQHTHHWESRVRVGQIGNSDGMGFSCVRLINNVDILAYAFQGQFYRWKQSQERHSFVPAPTVSGHLDSVTDLCWERSGRYFVSVSADQTSRLWTKCKSNNNSSWHELSRPQIHGYNLECLAFLPTLEHVYVSGAEEKVLRVFDASQPVVDRLEEMSAYHHHHHRSEDDIPRTKQRCAGAFVPELSLTNKQMMTTMVPDEEKSPTSLKSAPFGLPLEDELTKQLLWPELHKLYGHGQELSCVAAMTHGRLLASASKARTQNTKAAAIWLWNTTTWLPLTYQLGGHTASVVQLAFSPDDTKLASVSKDRTLCIHQKKSLDSDGEEKFHLKAKCRGHRRIIWTCAWSPDSRVVVTGSRDQTARFWMQGLKKKELSDVDEWTEHGCLHFSSAVTAVAFYHPPQVDDNDSREYFLAIGLESGQVDIWQHRDTNEQEMDDDDDYWTHRSSLLSSEQPTGAIKRIAWRPRQRHSESAELAIASADASIRVLTWNGLFSRVSS